MINLYLKNKKVLISGGTGTFGKQFVKESIKKGVKKIYVFSRDELKQAQMQKFYQGNNQVSFLIGDVRDLERLKVAFDEIDIVVHAAAQKQVPSCEYNPYEAVKTNVIGGQNVISAAIYCKVKKVIFLSTDKAVNPVNLYGATKLCMEKLAVNSASYIGSKRTDISVVRYGNVLGSRGSVLNVFLEAKKTGKIKHDYFVSLSDIADFQKDKVECPHTLLLQCADDDRSKLYIIESGLSFDIGPLVKQGNLFQNTGYIKEVFVLTNEIFRFR